MRILISSFGSAITLLHFLQVSTLSGSYMGINAFTFGSEVSCSINSLSVSILFQQPHFGHFMFSFWCNTLRFCLWFRVCSRCPLVFFVVFYWHLASRTLTVSIFRSQSHCRLSVISFSIWLCVVSEASGTKLTLIMAILLIWIPEGIKASEVF